MSVHPQTNGINRANKYNIEGDWTWGSVDSQFGFKDGGQVIISI